MDIDLILDGVTDPVIRENFKRLQTALLASTILGPDFTFFELDIPAGAKQAIPHALGYMPTDLAILSVIGNYNFYFRFDLFDKTNICVTAAGPVRVRFLLGKFDNTGKRSFADSKLTFVAPA